MDFCSDLVLEVELDAFVLGSGDVFLQTFFQDSMVFCQDYPFFLVPDLMVFYLDYPFF